VAWDLIHAANLTVPGVLADFKARTAYPSYKPAYDDPALKQPNDYFGGLKIGQLYSSLAPELPPFHQSPVWADATDALGRDVITPVMNDKKDAKTALEDLGKEIAQMKQ
jgi:ABC-type glycerol-3-phosphate transport system substrate-binding protein